MAGEKEIAELTEFLDGALTSYHTVKLVTKELVAAGFTELTELSEWGGVADRGLVRRDGALIAWIAPKRWNSTTGLRIYGCHTDSPALKIKPGGSFVASGFAMVDVELYGGALLYTWFDRELILAGRVVDVDGNVHLLATEPIARVSSMAPHLDRSQNDQLTLNKQRDLLPLLGLGEVNIEEYAYRRLGLQPAQVLASELFLVPAEPAAVFGIEKELLASARLDNKLSVFCGMQALRNAPQTDSLQIFAAFDHEEIGSQTNTGADGPFLEQVLQRLTSLAGHNQDSYQSLLARAYCLSADVVHAQHPNRADHHDPHVFPLASGGPAIKWSAPMRYATDAKSAAAFAWACQSAGVNMQTFVNHGNIPGGSTIGPFMTSRLGVHTVDAGIAILSMHSARELCVTSEVFDFTNVVRAFLTA